MENWNIRNDGMRDCTFIREFVKSFVVRHLVMALQEKDIPGASLCGEDPSELKIPELKGWLACRGARLKVNKADLVVRFVT